MKKNNFFFMLLLCTVSCSPAKDIAYFQNVDNRSAIVNNGLYEASIKPKDMLSITVVSSEPEASRRYNLITPQTVGSASSIYSQPVLQNYLVDNEGNINFPILGNIKVEGLKKRELELLLEKKLSPFFMEEMPVITIRIMNYSINILGEVLRPGKYETTNDRMTIFDALALAGDMTIYGRRDNVKIVRESPDGERKIFVLNLNDKSMFNSPAYFLEQNDVVYVEPNRSRANSSRYGAAESYRISTISVLMSLVTMTASILGLLR